MPNAYSRQSESVYGFASIAVPCVLNTAMLILGEFFCCESQSETTSSDQYLANFVICYPTDGCGGYASNEKEQTHSRAWASGLAGQKVIVSSNNLLQ